jgi:hypothetical protein
MSFLAGKKKKIVMGHSQRHEQNQASTARVYEKVKDLLSFLASLKGQGFIN